MGGATETLGRGPARRGAGSLNRLGRSPAVGAARFGHPGLRLEPVVEPRRFPGGVSRAANWLERGLPQGYRRTRSGDSAEAAAPKRVVVRPLGRHPQRQLTHPDRTPLHLTGASKIRLNADQMRALPPCARATLSSASGAGPRGGRDTLRDARI